MATAPSKRAPVRAPVFGSKLMVVTGHQASTLAALDAYRRGGNIIDATIAASAALATVVGQATSIGGDCFLLYHEAATGKVHALNASGVAPSLATPDVYKGGMKSVGPLAAAVPGLVRAWGALHKRFGTQPWAELIAPAIEIADGYPISFVMGERLAEDTTQLAMDPGCAGVYLPGGRPMQIGETLKQTALAKTLRRIARDGADEFYEGETARHLATAQIGRAHV